MLRTNCILFVLNLAKYDHEMIIHLTSVWCDRDAGCSIGSRLRGAEPPAYLSKHTLMSSKLLRACRLCESGSGRRHAPCSGRYGEVRLGKQLWVWTLHTVERFFNGRVESRHAVIGGYDQGGNHTFGRCSMVSFAGAHHEVIGRDILLPLNVHTYIFNPQMWCIMEVS